MLAATLTGTTTVAANMGVATFSNLRIRTPGTNYTIGASVGGVSQPTASVQESWLRQH